MKEGDEVICISEDFPEWKTTDEDKSRIGTTPKLHPIQGEILTIDEVLGDFIRFEKYDTEESVNWWHHSRFKKCELQDIVDKNVELFKSLRNDYTPKSASPNFRAQNNSRRYSRAAPEISRLSRDRLTRRDWR